MAFKMDCVCPNEDLLITQVFLRDVDPSCFVIVSQNVSKWAPI